MTPAQIFEELMCIILSKTPCDKQVAITNIASATITRPKPVFSFIVHVVSAIALRLWVAATEDGEDGEDGEERDTYAPMILKWIKFTLILLLRTA